VACISPTRSRSESGVLEPDAHAPVVTELFERRAAGEGMTALARWLDERVPRENGRLWTPARVTDMLGMRVYLGEAHYGLHVNRTAHPPLITQAQWHAAQAARAPSPPRSTSPVLLAGLVRCAACRYVMTPARGGAKSDMPVYRCRERHTAGRCPQPTTIMRERLEAYVEEHLLDVLNETTFVGRPTSAAVDAAASHLAEAEAELEAFANDLTARRLLGNGYHSALAARAHAVDAAQREVDQAAAGVASPAGLPPADGWSGLSIAERRTVLNTAVDAIFIRKARSSRAPIEERVHICWRGQGPDDLPRRGRDNGAVRAFRWPDEIPAA